MSALKRVAPALILLMLSAAFLTTAYGFNAQSAGAPVLVGWAMVALTGLDLLTRLQTPLGRVLMRALNPSAVEIKPAAQTPPWRPQFIAVAAVLAFAFILVEAGILYAVPVFAIPAWRFGAGWTWRRSVFGAAALDALIWVVFGRVLGLDLFPGLLFGGDW